MVPKAISKFFTFTYPEANQRTLPGFIRTIGTGSNFESLYMVWLPRNQHWFRKLIQRCIRWLTGWIWSGSRIHCKEVEFSSGSLRSTLLALKNRDLNISKDWSVINLSNSKLQESQGWDDFAAFLHRNACTQGQRQEGSSPYIPKT